MASVVQTCSLLVHDLLSSGLNMLCQVDFDVRPNCVIPLFSMMTREHIFGRVPKPKEDVVANVFLPNFFKKSVTTNLRVSCCIYCAESYCDLMFVYSL
jgi:hypothetical protein